MSGGLLFSIPGPPVGKGRPRATSRGGRVRMFTPPKTAQWEGVAMTIMKQSFGGPPLDEPLELHVVAVADRPQRLLRARDSSERMWRTAKPEGDNVLKCVGDALTKAGVIRDDCLIVRWSVESVYAARGEAASVQLWLCAADETWAQGYGATKRTTTKSTTRETPSRRGASTQATGAELLSTTTRPVVG